MTTLSGFSHVALTVTDIRASRGFNADALGMSVLDSSETYCALMTGSTDLSALILTTHAETLPGPFSEFRAGLDHLSFAMPDEDALAAWEERLRERAVPFDARRSEWGHHLNFRDPDNIAVELVLLRPDGDVQAILDDRVHRPLDQLPRRCQSLQHRLLLRICEGREVFLEDALLRAPQALRQRRRGPTRAGGRSSL